jgi:hypothetical protein
MKQQEELARLKKKADPPERCYSCSKIPGGRNNIDYGLIEKGQEYDIYMLDQLWRTSASPFAAVSVPITFSIKPALPACLRNN